MAENDTHQNKHIPGNLKLHATHAKMY